MVGQNGHRALHKKTSFIVLQSLPEAVLISKQGPCKGGKKKRWIMKLKGAAA